MSEEKNKWKSEVKFTINLDENKLPEKIEWSATDSGKEDQECKAVLLSIWDAEENNTLKIDLWTKDMLVDEMKLFFHQTLLSMADTLERSTSEQGMAEEMRRFGRYFADKLELFENDD